MPKSKTTKQQQQNESIIDIAGLNKVELLRALWDGQVVARFFEGRNIPHPIWDSVVATEAVDRGYIDYFQGRCIKTNLSGDTVDATKYDDDAGVGAMARIVRALRQRADGSVGVDQKTSKKKKKVSRERARRDKTTRVNFGMFPLGKLALKRKNIQYSNYAKNLINERSRSSSSSSSTEDKGKSERSKTRMVRFKKDAKIILERVLILWLRRVAEVCKTVCNQEGLSKIKERNIYTQIRLTYPPSDQDKMINYCKKAMQSYVTAKIASNTLKEKGSMEELVSESHSNTY